MFDTPDTVTPVVPPAPAVLDKPLKGLPWMIKFFQSAISVYSQRAFEVSFTRFNSMGSQAVLLNDPKDIHHVLQSNMANYKRSVIQPRILRAAMGDGLFLSEADEWRRQRRVLAPVFTPSAISNFTPHFQAAGQLMVDRLQRGGVFRLSEVFNRTTLDAVMRALFSMPVDESRSGLGRQVNAYLLGPGRQNILDFLAKGENDFAWALRSRRRLQKQWFATVDEIIAERKAKGHVVAQSGVDLLDHLLAMRDPQTGEALPEAEIRDQCGTMLCAGFETTARLLFWASYMLCLDEAEQERIRTEVTAFPVASVKSMQDLAHWPRLRNVLLETARLYPSIPFIVRVAIGEDELHGEKVVPGTRVVISPWVIHRHHSFWENPTAFAPDRFAGKTAPWTGSEGYMPFGYGQRTCIGASFAVLETHIILAELIANFRVRVETSEPIVPLAKIVIVPNRDANFVFEPIASTGH